MLHVTTIPLKKTLTKLVIWLLKIRLVFTAYEKPLTSKSNYIFFRSLSLKTLTYTWWKGRFYLHLTQFGSEFERYPWSHKINQVFHIISYYFIKVGSVKVLKKMNMEHIMFIRWGLMDITRYLIFTICNEELTIKSTFFRLLTILHFHLFMLPIRRWHRYSQPTTNYGQ